MDALNLTHGERTALRRYYRQQRHAAAIAGDFVHYRAIVLLERVFMASNKTHTAALAGKGVGS